MNAAMSPQSQTNCIETSHHRMTNHMANQFKRLIEQKRQAILGLMG